LLGASVNGKLDAGVDFTPQGDRTLAKFELDGENLAAGQLGGSVHISGEGTTDSVAAQLSAKIPDLNGFAAELTADAQVDLEHRAVHVLHAKMDYRGQQIHLLSAAKVSYGSAFSIDELKAGVQDASLATCSRPGPASAHSTPGTSCEAPKADGFTATVSAAATTQRGGMAVSRLEGRGFSLGSHRKAWPSINTTKPSNAPFPGPVPRIGRSLHAVTGMLACPGSDAARVEGLSPRSSRHHWRRL
jgi:hypothetical protein